MSNIVAVDVGGTFTDVILFDPKTKSLHVTKTPSTPQDQSIGVMEGIRKICARAGVARGEVSLILHGTTVATNAVLEGKGARVGLVVTRGYAQILHLARSWTPGPLAGWIIMQKPAPLASVDDTLEVDERVAADGSILKPIDMRATEKLLDALIARGVSALTVCLMNSYVNPAHELALKELLARKHPELPVTVSSDVLPEFREYERALTTVMNSYVKPKMRSYLANLEKRLTEDGGKTTLNIIRSDGGLMSAQGAAENPVHTMLSGPSGGVAGAALIGRTSGHPDIIAFDMGGTSTDVSLTNKGVPRIARETKVGIYPVKAPSVEVISIGAGGGSIAHVPLTGALRVGPQSAGAEPGPACYGHGGTEPTVTDANVVLGYLPPKLVGGEMTLDVQAAHTSVATIADKLGIDVYQAAKGIVDIVNENMLGAIRVMSVEKGHNPRDFGLIPFGGAGPLHGNALAMLSGAWPVIVPTMPGVLSALGFLASDFRNEFSKTSIKRFNALNPAEVTEELASLGERAQAWLAEEGVAESQRKVDYEIDMRYLRQGFELPIRVTIEEVKTRLATIATRFTEEHERLYGFKLDAEIEAVNLRAVAIGREDRIRLNKQPKRGLDVREAIVDPKHKAYFDGEFVTTPIYDRAALDVGHKLRGPAILTQMDTNTLILPGHVAEIDEFHNVIVKPA